MHLLLLALLPLALALSCRQPPLYPPHSLSTSFRLVANVTTRSPPLSINNHVLASYHLYPGHAAAVLVPPSTPSKGRQFYLNGTTQEARDRRGSTSTYGGTPPFPNGLLLSPQAAPGTAAPHDVFIDAGPGTTGVQPAPAPAPLPVLTGPDLGHYYACNNTGLPFGAAVALYYAYEGEETPGGCVDVTMLPECAGGGGGGEGVGEYGGVL